MTLKYQSSPENSRMNKNYKANLKALKRGHQFLCEELQKEKTCSWFAARNELDFSVTAENNEVFASPHEKPESIASMYEYHNDEASIIIGIGNGSMLYEVCQRKKEKHIILVLEEEYAILQYALHNYNFSKWIKNNTLLFIHTKTPEEALALIAYIDSANVISDWLLFVEPYVFMRHSVYGKKLQKVQAYINHLRCNTGTVMMAGGMIAKNDIENLPYVIRHKGINVFKDSFKNKPAILVSTGPSLRKNIHLLKQVQNKAVIIAVGQALRVLLAYDIVPDFIATVDFGEVNMTHFTGLMDSEVPLIALNRTYAPLIREWKGEKYIAASINPGFEQTVAGMLDDRGSLEQGGSVSHFVFGFALHLGCNPIAMIGQDLALTDGQSHNPNADSSGTISIIDGQIQWIVSDPRSGTLNKETHSMGDAITVPGYYGKPVLTNIGLASFITAYEDIIRRSCNDILVINATEGGAHIEGTTRMSLKTVIAMHCKDIIDKSVIAENKGLRDNYIDDITEAIKRIENELQLMDELAMIADKGLMVNKQLEILACSKKINKKHFHDLIDMNKEYSEKAHSISEKNPLIRLHIYNIARTIQHRSLKVKGETKHLYKNREDLQTRVKRNKMILEAAVQAVEDLKPSYEKTLSALKEYMLTKNETVLTSHNEYVPSVADSEQYFAAGNWARPYLDALKLNNQEICDRCIQMRQQEIAEAEQTYNEREKEINYTQLLYDAKKTGMEKKNYAEALELLDAAIDIFPERLDARWGKATSLHHLGKSDEAIKIYEMLVSEFPESMRLKFEYCLVLLNVDFKFGMEQIINFLEDTPNEFQYFWRNIGELYEPTDHKAALTAYKKYNEKYPADFAISKKIKELTGE